MTYLAAVLSVVTAALGLSAAWLQFRSGQHSRAGQRGGRIPKRRLAGYFRSFPEARPGEIDQYQDLEPVSCGAVTIDVSMIVGNLRTAWLPEEISARYDAEWFTEVPRKARTQVDANLANRLAEARDNGAVIFDGTTYALRDYRLVVTDPATERTSLELLLGPTTFFEFLATNQSLPDMDSLGHEDVPCSFSNQLAVNFSVITADGFFLLQRRSRRVANFRGLLASV